MLMTTADLECIQDHHRVQVLLLQYCLPLLLSFRSSSPRSRPLPHLLEHLRELFFLFRRPWELLLLLRRSLPDAAVVFLSCFIASPFSEHLRTRRLSCEPQHRQKISLALRELPFGASCEPSSQSPQLILSCSSGLLSEAIFSACELGACTCCFPPGGNLQISCLVRLAMARRHGSPQVFVSMCGPLPPRHPRRVLIVFLINLPPPTNFTTIIFSFVALASCLDAMAQPSAAPLLAIEPAVANALSRCFALGGRRDPTLLLHRAILSTRRSPFLWWPRRHVLVESSQTCSCAFVVFHHFVTSRGLFLPPHRASCPWSSIFLLS